MPETTKPGDLHLRVPVLDDKDEVIVLNVTVSDQSARRMIFMSAHRTNRLGQVFTLLRDAVIERYRDEHPPKKEKDQE